MIRPWSLLLKLQRDSLDRCANGGGLLLHIREDRPSGLLIEYKPLENVECLFVEINIKKKKSFFVGHIIFIKKTYLITCTI